MKKSHEAMTSSKLRNPSFVLDIGRTSSTTLLPHLALTYTPPTHPNQITPQIKLRSLATVRADRHSGTLGLLWAKRAVEFIMMYLELLATKKDLTSSQCARTTYESVLMKYHGWITSKLVSASMSLAPTREDIFLKLGLKADAEVEIQKMVQVLHEVVAEIQALLDKNGCDFPDKV